MPIVPVLTIVPTEAARMLTISPPVVLLIELNCAS
jgi:hypothetical protein